MLTSVRAAIETAKVFVANRGRPPVGLKPIVWPLRFWQWEVWVEEGRLAAGDGKTKADCPYPEGSEANVNWNYGRAFAKYS